MSRFSLIKHYRGPEEFVRHPPQGAWSEESWAAHLAAMEDLVARLRETGEFVMSAALAEEGEWIRAGEPGAGPESAGLGEEKDLVAGWLLIDVTSQARAREIAAELSAAPGPDGAPLREWLEMRAVL